MNNGKSNFNNLREWMEAQSSEELADIIWRLSLLAKEPFPYHTTHKHQFFQYLQLILERVLKEVSFPEGGGNLARWEGFDQLTGGYEGLAAFNRIYERNALNREISDVDETDLQNALLGVFGLEAYYEFIKVATETPAKLLDGKVTPIFMRQAVNWMAGKYTREHYDTVLAGLSLVRAALSVAYPVLPAATQGEDFARVMER